MLDFFRGQAWKAGAIGAGLLSLIMTGLLIASYIENRAIAHQRDQLRASIMDPHTGYVARLAQARTNVATLQAALDDQNRKIDQMKQESDQKLAEAKLELARLTNERDSAQRRWKAMLDLRPQGSTLEERILDVDARIMKELTNAS